MGERMRKKKNKTKRHTEGAVNRSAISGSGLAVGAGVGYTQSTT